MPQVDAVGEELLDLLHRGIHLAPVLLVLFFLFHAAKIRRKNNIYPLRSTYA
jgi:hypothetical protein